MIVPMKKVSVVVLNSERKESLRKLRRIGLIHLEEVEGKGPVLAAYKEASANADKAISILDEIKLPKKHMNIRTADSCHPFFDLSKSFCPIFSKTEFSLSPWIITINPHKIPRDLKSMYPR